MDKEPLGLLKVEDPNVLTINGLKSLLSREGVSLPTSHVKKEEYVRIFNEAKEKRMSLMKFPPKKRTVSESSKLTEEEEEESGISSSKRNRLKEKSRKSEPLTKIKKTARKRMQPEMEHYEEKHSRHSLMPTIVKKAKSGNFTLETSNGSFRSLSATSDSKEEKVSDALQTDESSISSSKREESRSDTKTKISIEKVSSKQKKTAKHHEIHSEDDIPSLVPPVIPSFQSNDIDREQSDTGQTWNQERSRIVHSATLKSQRGSHSSDISNTFSTVKRTKDSPLQQPFPLIIRNPLPQQNQQNQKEIRQQITTPNNNNNVLNGQKRYQQSSEQQKVSLQQEAAPPKVVQQQVIHKRIWFSRVILFFLLSLMIAVVAVFLQWFFSPIIFCDTKKPIDSNCDMLCPENGNCSKGQLCCDYGFEWTGFYWKGLYWLDVQCRKDSSIRDQVIHSAAKNLEILRGNYECENGNVNNNFYNISKNARELREDLRHLKSISSNCEIEAFLNKYLASIEEDIKRNNSLLASYNDETNSEKRFYAKNGRRPFFCQLRFLAYDYIWLWLPVLLIALGILEYRRRRIQREKEMVVAHQLLIDVCNMLQRCKMQNMGQECSLVPEHIRDTLLSLTMPSKIRIRIWNQLCGLVALDTRILATTTMRDGEQKTVWEWIGPLSFDSSLNSSPPRGLVGNGIGSPISPSVVSSISMLGSPSVFNGEDNDNRDRTVESQYPFLASLRQQNRVENSFSPSSYR